MAALLSAAVAGRRVAGALSPLGDPRIRGATPYSASGSDNHAQRAIVPPDARLPAAVPAMPDPALAGARYRASPRRNKPAEGCKGSGASA